MRLEVEDLADGVTRVKLFGRMDIAGVGEIALRFTSVTAVDRRRVIVDLSGVDFVSSMGVRAVLENARALKLRGGSMAIMGANDLVAQVLDSAGVGHVVPMASDLPAATAALGAR